MKIQAANNDLGYEIIYEKGNRVILNHPNFGKIFGTIVGGPLFRKHSESAYEIKPNGTMKSLHGLTGSASQFEPHALTKTKLPILIKQWKRNQARKLIGVNNE